MKRKSFSKTSSRSLSPVFFGERFSLSVLISICCALLFLSMVAPHSLQGLRTQALDIFTPILSALSKPFQMAVDAAGNVSGLTELRADNARLMEENARLQAWYQAALVLEAENKSLRDLMNLRLESNHSFITTRVIADTGNSYVKSLIVAAGTKDGVQKGQAVISEAGLIGRVIETGRHSARVLLIHDVNSRVPVLVENTKQHAVLAGNNHSQPTLIHLPPDSAIKTGDTLITSGHGGVFPYGIPVGTIVQTDTQEIMVEPLSDMSRISYVRVVQKSEQNDLADLLQ